MSNTSDLILTKVTNSDSVKSREMLASDLGSVFIQSDDADVTESGDKTKKEDISEEEQLLRGPDAQMISNIVSTMSREMGILLNKEKQFIISNVVNDLREQLADEADYDVNANYFSRKRT